MPCFRPAGIAANVSRRAKHIDDQYWPEQYIVDQSGKIVFEHCDEVQYDVIERTIQKLLSANGLSPEVV
jgi:hypothetical protein